MSVLDGFKGAGLLTKIAFVLLIFAAFFAWVAYTCTGWGFSESHDTKAINGFCGLWSLCSDYPYIQPCKQPNDGMQNAQAMVATGFLGINIAIFLFITFMFVPGCQKNREIAMATSIICIITGLFYAVGVIVFGINFRHVLRDLENSDPTRHIYKLSYAFGLSILALVLEILSGFLVLLNQKCVRVSSSEKVYTPNHKW